MPLIGLVTLRFRIADRPARDERRWRVLSIDHFVPLVHLVEVAEDERYCAAWSRAVPSTCMTTPGTRLITSKQALGIWSVGEQPGARSRNVASEG